MADREPADRPYKIKKRARMSSVAGDPPSHKPVVSFRKKATELARTTGRLLAPSKPLPPGNPAAIPPSSTTEGPPSASRNTPCSRAQAALDPPRPQLFRPEGFSGCVQNFRERRTEDNLQRFHERYGGVIVENARRDLVELTTTHTSTGSSDASKGRQPTQKRRVQRTSGGKRMSKAQAQAEEVMKICRSAKSYIVDMAAFKRREVSTPPELQQPTPAITPSSAQPHSVRPEKTVPSIASQRVSSTRLATTSPVPQLPSTSLGGVPRGLKFTRRQRPAPEPGEIGTETVGRDARKPGLASASRDNGPLAADVSKRRREDAEKEPGCSSPRKKPRLGRS